MPAAADEGFTVCRAAISMRWHTEGGGNRLVGRPVFEERWATLPREPGGDTGRIVSIVWLVRATHAVGSGSESRAPMAIAVIGGMAFSTLLSLYVVPAACRILSRLESKFGKD